MGKRRYPGISPFNSDQKDIFFGREDDINKLYKLILLRNQVLIYSKSGVGKTSLLNAGVLPKLENEFIIIKVRFFAYDNIKSISPVNSILQNAKDLHISDYEDKNTLLDQLFENKNYEKTLWYHFKKMQLLNQQLKKIILVFDQFEELFTYPPNQINQFKEQLYELTKVNIPDNIISLIADKSDQEKNVDNEILYEDLKVKVVFAIRSDHLSFLNELTDKLNDIQEIFYELKPLSDNQARQAITLPANDIAEFDTPAFALTSEALNNITIALSNHGTQNIETTQLQIVCQRIEEIALKKAKTADSNEPLIIQEKDLPKFEDIFLSFYLDSINRVLVAEGRNEKDNARKFIEEQLIRNENRISLDEVFCLDSVKISTLKTLVDTHLLRAENNSTGGFSYELSHDSLVFPILNAKKERESEEVAQIQRKKQNKSYLIINILSAPVLILFLGLLLRYKEDYQYLFSDNNNIPFYLFTIAIIVQFFGFAAGSEEMIRERRFSIKSDTNKAGYIHKKIALLLLFSAVQVLLLVMVGNLILKIRGMDFYYWLILFSSAITANLTGLIISILIKDPVVVNTLIVFLLVPQIFLSGYLIPYQDLNPDINSEEYTPISGDLLPARWSYEALAVKQAKDNKFEKRFFKYKKIKSDASYYSNFWVAELNNQLGYCIDNLDKKSSEIEIHKRLLILGNEFEKIEKKYEIRSNVVQALRAYRFDKEIQQRCQNFLGEIRKFSIDEYNLADQKIDSIITDLEHKGLYLKYSDEYLNKKLNEIVTNKNSDFVFKGTIKNKLIRYIDPIYLDADSKYGRSHLYAPNKRLGNVLIDTYWFNLMILWLMSFVIYLILILTLKSVRFKSILESILNYEI